MNDFNRFGRTYQVVVQADGAFRRTPEDIGKLRVRNAAGRDGADQLAGDGQRQLRTRPRAALQRLSLGRDQRRGAPGVSSGEAEAAHGQARRRNAAAGHEVRVDRPRPIKNSSPATPRYLIYPLCLLLVFLVLAAQYESLRLPLAIILIVPMCLLSALARRAG